MLSQVELIYVVKNLFLLKIFHLNIYKIVNKNSINQIPLLFFIVINKLLNQNDLKKNCN